MPETKPYDSDFMLGEPALVCRWRLAGATLPLENRHLRALSRRHLGDAPLDDKLVAWAKQHIEWTLASGAAEHPDGVLMLMVDERGRAAMTVGPYEPLTDRRLPALLARADLAEREADQTDVAPETIWSVVDGGLVWGLGEGCVPSGTASLVEDLARTLGISVERRAGLLDEVRSGGLAFDEAFVVSDEHGVALPEGLACPLGERFLEGYGTLLRKARRLGQGS